MANMLFNLPSEFFYKDGRKKKVFFYGLGGIGKLLARNSAALSVLGLEPDYFIDADPQKSGQCIRVYNYYLNGHREIPVISLDACMELGMDNPIVVTVRIAEPIVMELEHLGFSNIWVLPISSGNARLDGLTKTIYSLNKEIEHVCERLQDDLSRKLFQSIIQIRCNEGTTNSLVELASTDRYSPPDLFSFSERAVIIDAGGLDGDTAIEFAEKTRYTYKHIYTFEPNPQMLPLLRKRQLPRHTIIDKALSSVCGKTTFLIGGIESSISKGGSRISDFGNYEVETVTLDSMLDSIIPPTYIKMDIEGAEMDALAGMDAIIRQFHPVLSVCIYHKPLDILQIPEYLMEKYPFYRFYIRHHSDANTDTVLYCVP